MNLLERRSNGGNARKDADAATPTRTTVAQRMLIAEDEALVAIMMEDIVAELGWSVIGPFAKAADALAAAEAEDIDAAILDINLGGESVYPVADALMRRGVPFVFTTGYGAESIDRRFATAPILHKPIDRKMLEEVFSAAGHLSAVISDSRETADAGYPPP
jgi:CheY-like chemotaxis protein